MIYSKVVCDSVGPLGPWQRLTTFRLKFPKLILAEFNTHRVFSRNASSSRAIPTLLYIEEARSDEFRATPVYWGSKRKGMEQGPEIEGKELEWAKAWWKEQALRAADDAEKALEKGLHKDIVNRILEPYVHANVMLTATELQNFFGLRLMNAKPEMMALARAIYGAYERSVPKELDYTEWHLPLISPEEQSNLIIEDAIRVSVARCARVSYMSYKTQKYSSVEEDMILCRQLMLDGHWSPFEHIATPDSKNHDGTWRHPYLHGNLTGFLQYRKSFIGEDIRAFPKDFTELLQ